MQAMRLGARLNATCEVVGLRAETGFHAVTLSDGSEIPTRAVIVASGARYRRLPVDGLERFEGAGVYYAATDLEARVCDGSSVLVVGGGNSAGQAAIYLSQHNCSVTIAIRRGDLQSTMSSYLIDRIRASAGIELVTGVEVDALAGARAPGARDARGPSTGARREAGLLGPVLLHRREPRATSWLGAGRAARRGRVRADRPPAARRRGQRLRRAASRLRTSSSRRSSRPVTFAKRVDEARRRGGGGGLQRRSLGARAPGKRRMSRPPAPRPSRMRVRESADDEEGGCAYRRRRG